MKGRTSGMLVITLTLLSSPTTVAAGADQVTVRLPGQKRDLKCGPAHPVGSPAQKTFYSCGSTDHPTLVVESPLGWTAIQTDSNGEPRPVNALRAQAGSRVVYENSLAALAFGASSAAPATMADSMLRAQNVVGLLNFWNSQSGRTEPVAGLGDPIQPAIDEFLARAKARVDELNSVMSKTERIIATTADGTRVECRRSPRKPEAPEIPGCELYRCPTMTVDGQEYDAVLQHPGNLASFGTPMLMLTRPGKLGPIHFGNLRTEIPGRSQPAFLPNSVLLGGMHGTGSAGPAEPSWQEQPIPSLGISMNSFRVWTAVQPSIGMFNLPAACEGPEIAAAVRQQDQAVAAAKEAMRGIEFVQVFEEANGGFQSALAPAEFASESFCRDERGRYWKADAYSRAAARRYERRLAPDSGPPISLDRARRLFDELKARDDIPWGYTPDGCYARAEATESFLQRRGLEVSKTWINGDLSPRAKPDVRWTYHVAASVPVTQPDGTVAQMVFDPALATGPVTEEEWANLMELKSGPLMRTEFPPPADSGSYGRTVLSRSSDYPYAPNGDLSLKERDFRKDAKATNQNYRRILDEQEVSP